MANDMQVNAIEVNLDQVHGARAFENENSFFQRELEQALEIVWRLGERAAKEKRRTEQGVINDLKESDILHSHDCISVFGRRGVGKTSFILSLGMLVKNRILIGSDWTPNCKIAVLPPIDPTMMEDTDTFLALVLANVLQYIEKELGSKEWPEYLNASLSDLGSKVGVLAPISVHEAQWKEILLDAECFNYEILKKARSGIGLAKSVNQLLLSCAKACNVDAFMQAIDDVDTAVQRGWPVLETLRKYLSSPYLITVLTGDAQLFDVMVVQQKLKNLDTAINLENTIKTPSNTGRITRSLVDHLVDQYLMKIMPPHQRVLLPIVAEEVIEAALRGRELVRVKCREQRSYSGQKKGDVNRNADDFSRLFKALTLEILHFPNSLNASAIDSLDCFKPEVAGFLSKLIPRFTRSLIQFMEMLEANKESLNETATDRDLLFGQLMHVFEITLSRRGILRRDMERLWHGEHMEWLTKFCLEVRQDAPMLWSLDRDYDDVGWTQRLLLLQASLLQGWKRCILIADQTGNQQYRLLNPAGPMSYIIKTCLLCWIADDRQLNDEKVIELKSLMRIGISNDHVETASLSLAYLLRDDDWPARSIFYLLPPVHWSRDAAEMHMRDLSENNAAPVAVDSPESSKDGSGAGSDKPLKFESHGYLPWWRVLYKIKLKSEGEEDWKKYYPDLGAFERFAGPNARFLMRWFGFYRYRPSHGDMRCYVAPIIGFARIIDLIAMIPRSDGVGAGSVAGNNASTKTPASKIVTPELIRGIQDLIRVRLCEVGPSDARKAGSSNRPSDNENNGEKADGIGGAKDAASTGPFDDSNDKTWEVVKEWSGCLICWRHSLEQMHPGDVPPPRVMSRVFVRMLDQLKVMNSPMNYPESSWSVGQFLEQWVCCFFNALIIEELNYQIYRLEKYADIRLDHDVVAKGVEALRRNLQVLAEHAELGQFSRKWLGCPLLVAVIRKELRDSIKKAVEKKAAEASWDEEMFQDSLPVNREPGGAGEEKTSALADVDVYSQLCSLMYQVMPPFPENSEKQAWQKRAETYGYPTPKNGLGEKNPSDGR